MPVTVLMMSSTVRKLRIESAERSVSISDLIAEALAQRPVGPIRPDTPVEAAARTVAAAKR